MWPSCLGGYCSQPLKTAPTGAAPQFQSTRPRCGWKGWVIQLFLHVYIPIRRYQHFAPRSDNDTRYYFELPSRSWLQLVHVLAASRTTAQSSGALHAPRWHDHAARAPARARSAADAQTAQPGHKS